MLCHKPTCATRPQPRLRRCEGCCNWAELAIAVPFAIALALTAPSALAVSSPASSIAAEPRAIAKGTAMASSAQLQQPSHRRRRGWGQVAQVGLWQSMSEICSSWLKRGAPRRWAQQELVEVCRQWQHKLRDLARL